MISRKDSLLPPEARRGSDSGGPVGLDVNRGTVISAKSLELVHRRKINQKSTRTSDRRRNLLKAIRFEKPDYIPMLFHVNEACWDHYPSDALKELVADHKFLFPDSRNAPSRTELRDHVPERIGKPFTDGWGCVWETSMDGMVGSVTRHPLKSWDNFDNYIAPDPQVDSGKGAVDWNKQARDLLVAKAQGNFTVAGLRHGHTFLQLIDIRGYENLVMDMFDEDPRLWKLIEMVEQFNAEIVKNYLDIGVDMMTYAEDLGMQNGPMILPEMFQKYIKPSYERLMKPAVDAGCIIHMHSDGHIHELAQGLIEGGVAAVNLQDLVNGIDWIKENLKGRVCIDLDIDRQTITPKGTPEQVEGLIREEVEKLGSKEGGLMMIYGLYPGVPLENVKALMDAMEKYAFYYSE
jgi:uroporphyrinogen decarboxylase